MSYVRMPPNPRFSQRWIGASMAAAVFVLAAASTVWQVSAVTAVVFGLLVPRPAALWLALVPFLVALPRADGSGEPPDWVAGLVFATPIYALFIAGGVVIARLWRAYHARNQ